MVAKKKIQEQLEQLDRINGLKSERTRLEQRRKHLSSRVFHTVANLSPAPFGDLGQQIRDCAHDLDVCISRIQDAQDALYRK